MALGRGKSLSELLVGAPQHLGKAQAGFREESTCHLKTLRLVCGRGADAKSGEDLGDPGFKRDAEKGLEKPPKKGGMSS